MTKKMYQIIVLLPESAQMLREYLPILESFQKNRIHDIQWKTCDINYLNEAVSIFLKNGDIFKIKYGKLSEKELVDTLCPGG